MRKSTEKEKKKINWEICTKYLGAKVWDSKIDNI